MRLILLRHAKSDWHGSGTDHDRPLTPRGKRDALRVAHRLARMGWIPDRVVCSDAARTMETWTRMAPAFGRPIDAVVTRRLYDAGVGALASVLAEVATDVDTVLAIGHNPGWEVAVGVLGGTPATLTTTNAALLERDDVPWDEAITANAWRLVTIVRPKELGDGGEATTTDDHG
jgi:phosphohistidine phosphatase